MPLQKIPKETILAAIAKIGPSQPIDIRKELKEGDSFLIGAMLSELVAEGKLKISHTRRGGGPFYYDPNAMQRLEEISKYLNEKDRRTCEMLKVQRVMREDTQEPLVRVGLQSIHDFSYQLVVDDNGKQVVYWRYFLVPEEEALRIINKEEKVEKKIEAQKSSEGVTEKSEEKKEIVSSKSTTESKQETDSVQQKPEKKPRKRAAKPKAETQMMLEGDWTVHDTLYEKVQKFAVANNGTLHNPQSVKLHAELTCILKTEGPFGKMTYYVLALNRKKITDKDITRPLLHSRGIGMPLLILYVEELPPKIVKGFEDTVNVNFRRL